MVDYKNLIALLFFAYSILVFINKNKNFPLLGVLTNWIKWIGFSFLFCFLLDYYELSNREPTIHFITGMCVWFILDTLFNQVYISIAKEIEVFPRYKKEIDNNFWLVEPFVLKTKEDLRKNNYRKIDLIQAEVRGGTKIKQMVFLNNENRTRINIYLIQNNNTRYFISIFNKSKNGFYLITDNTINPFGGCYPKSWDIKKYPMFRSFSFLLKKHEKRMKKAGKEWEKFDENIINQINDEQRVLKNTNIDLGYLQITEGGARISPKGSFKLWVGIWVLSYFGIIIN